MLFVDDLSWHDRSLKFAIVRHRPRAGGLSFFPDTCPMQNVPNGTGKGDDIHIESNWWHHIERINSERGYKWARSIGNMWINKTYNIDVPYSTAPAESIHCGGNFIAYDLETPHHVRLVAYPYRMDTTNLKDNWFNKPWMFWKACMVNSEGEIGKVANALDVYFPLIAERELWINKIYIEKFPDGPDYRLQGKDVYDGSRPLLVNGNFLTDWKLETKGVV